MEESLEISTNNSLKKALFLLTHFLVLAACLVTQSCLTLCNPMDYAHQASLSMEFPRQEYWSGLPFPSPQNLPDPGIKLALASGFFTCWAIRDCWITEGKKGMKEEGQRGGMKGGRKMNEGKQDAMMWDVSWDLHRWKGCIDYMKFYWKRGKRRMLILGGKQIVSTPKISCGIQINQTCILSPRSFLSSNRFRNMCLHKIKKQVVRIVSGMGPLLKSIEWIHKLINWSTDKVFMGLPRRNKFHLAERLLEGRNNA